MLENNTHNQLDRYIDLCDKKIEYHTQNAKNSRIWETFLSISNIFIASLNILTLVIMTTLDAEHTTTSIVSGTFAFVLVISTKVKDQMNFQALNIQHNNSLDSYSDIKMELEKLARSDDFHLGLDTLLIRYEAVVQKSHFQTVRCCYLCCCLG
jgi:hypothetical protein